jgi:oligopeptide transport system ATP-binding protein
MYLGRIVEIATRDELFKNPRHPYTRALMSSIPSIGSGKKKMTKILSGEIPSPINPPKGCAFHPRCAHKIKECSEITPQLHGDSPLHLKACHVNLDTNLKEIL